MFEKAFDEISLGDLQALVEARIPEGRPELQSFDRGFGDRRGGKRAVAKPPT
jgi:hypothetical protein